MKDSKFIHPQKCNGSVLEASANKKSWKIIKQDIDESDFYLINLTWTPLA